MNNSLTEHLLDEVFKTGIREFCVCAGARNAPLVHALAHSHSVKVYYWFEERSAAFFALGRAQATKRPIAIITTSGTASGELLPAAMEAHYSGLPLLFITADRPRRFRGTGAPQSAEQVGLFGPYVQFCVDIEGEERCNLEWWNLRNPAHVNVCYEEPQAKEFPAMKIVVQTPSIKPDESLNFAPHLMEEYRHFIEQANYPFVIVSSVPKDSHEALVQFLVELNAPVYLEALSGIREDQRLSSIRVTAIDQVWRFAEESGYSIDAVLRIGGVPTARLWRDLEKKEGKIKVCSISEQPFSGLSWGGVINASIKQFADFSKSFKSFNLHEWKTWMALDHRYHHALIQLTNEEPEAEQTLVYKLSNQIQTGSRIYLGNSLPIREWDLMAIYDNKRHTYGASRGLNGIDGQISTFLGWSVPNVSNWALLGDLTALYDMAAPWILTEIPHHEINIVIINNGGGKIFSRMFSHPAFCNLHALEFSHLAEFWKLPYTRLTSLQDPLPRQKQQIIEIIPNNDATDRFWAQLSRV